MGSGTLNAPGEPRQASPESPAGTAGRSGRGALALAAVLGFVLAFSAGPGCSSTPSDANRPDGGPVCAQGGAGCGDGFACVHNNCVPTCPGGAACPSGSYCEGPTAPFEICSPDAPIACTSSFDCPTPQSCSYGLCTAIELRADGGNQGCVIAASANDGCSPGALCYQQGSTSGGTLNRCVGLPHCGQDGACPVGSWGSTCNVMPDGGQLFPGKQRLCLFSFCVRDTDCPSTPTTAVCFHPAAGDPLGKCQFGSAGDTCFSNQDCFNSVACILADGGTPTDGGLGTCSN